MLKQRLQVILFGIFTFFLFASYMVYVVDQKDNQIKELQIQNRIVKQSALKEVNNQQKQISELRKDYQLLKSKRFLTENDIASLERIVEIEAQGEKLRGKLLVACVVLNRWNSTQNKSIKQVIFAPGQFPQSSKKFYSTTPTYETKQAVILATFKDYSKGSMYFMNPTISSRSNVRWFRNKLEFKIKFKAHEFYKPKER